MIANARMYSVSPVAADAWRTLLRAVIEEAGVEATLLEHPEPKPMHELWQRPDMAAVFMCGLPFSRAEPRPLIVAAPVPEPADYRGLPQYWSDLVVRADSRFSRIEETFGGRLALTAPDSQSGCWAALEHLMWFANALPLYQSVIAPQITPLGAVQAVIDGSADVAPIDSYAHCLLRRFRPELTAQLRTIGRTSPTPMPLLVASARRAESSPRTEWAPGPGALTEAFLSAHRSAAAAPAMAELKLKCFVRAVPESYDALRLNFTAAKRYWGEHRLAAAVHPAFADSLQFTG